MTRVPIAETHAVDPPATQRVASALAPHLAVGDVVALRGDLGAGKSVFARAVIHSCGLAGVDVPSPTFTLVQTYAGRRGTGAGYRPFGLFPFGRPRGGPGIGVG